MMVTLPKPNGGFEWVQLPAGPALICRPLEAHARTLFTTRPWPLGGAENSGWSDVARAIGVEYTRLARVRQVHGAAAVSYREGEWREPLEPDANLPEADIVAADDQRLAIAVQTADCVPMLYVDRRTHAVAAAHAGWRGLAARVPLKAVDRLVDTFGVDPADLLVAIGPAVGACCYEVGEDVRKRFLDAGWDSGDLTRWFYDNPTVLPENPPMPALVGGRRGKWFFDGWQCARDQLLSAGVPANQISSAEMCTASHPTTFCSYRRDGVGAGRMAAVIRPSPLPR